MATFFIDPYKTYYEKLNSATGMVSSSTSMQEKSSFLVSTSSRLSAQVGSASWVEQGHTELVTSTLPSLDSAVLLLNDSIVSGLVKAVDISINQLLPVLVELKDTDILYENALKELNSLVEPARYKTVKHWWNGKSEQVETDEYREYVSKKTELEEKVTNLEKLCKTLVENAGNLATQINGLGGSVETISSKNIVTSSTGGRNYDGVKEYALSSDMEVSRTSTLINYGEYYVVNTNYSVIDYYNHVQDTKLYQAANKKYYNSCSTVAHLHAKELTLGTSKGNSLEDTITAGGIDTWYNKNNFIDENKQVVLNEIYNELSQGRPVTLNCANNSGGRHWVTVVGFKTDVQSGSELTADDLLIFDAWDGKIERMDCEDSRVMASGRTTGQNYDWRIDKMNVDRLASVPNNNTANV